MAGIDIGTLTCRMLIAEVTGSGALVEVRSDRRILRLGEGLAGNGRLTGPVMARVIDTLTGWRALIDRERVGGLSVVATSAVREAANAEEFLRRVEAEAGWAVRVLTGPEEAQLTFLGIRHGLSEPVGRVLGLDIGGGSTEFMYESAGAAPVVQSIPLGVVTLTERMLGADPLGPEQAARARAHVRCQVEPVQAKLGGLRGATLIGTAGAVTTMAAMIQGLSTYDRARIQGFRLPLEAVRNLEARVLGCTRAQRRELPGLEADRADVIVAGILILGTIMEALGFEECVVSDYGLREGIVLELAAKKGLAVRGKG